MQKLSYVNLYVMWFCEKFLNAGAEKLGSHREKNRYAAGLLIDCFQTIEYFRFWFCSQNHCIFSFRLFFFKTIRLIADLFAEKCVNFQMVLIATHRWINSFSIFHHLNRRDRCSFHWIKGCIILPAIFSCWSQVCMWIKYLKIY